jgi:PPK2 family polyphosphate:nucleotide phosphotransferase
MDEATRHELAKLMEPMRVAPGAAVTLADDFDPADTAGVEKEDAGRLLEAGVAMLADYQDKLAAQDTYGLLVVLQGIDASGKDSMIRHVMSGVNPQGVEVTSFKVPSDEELDHHYLWRYQKRVPRRGGIGIFNRSHYEEVLVVRVHPEHLLREKLPEEAKEPGIWKRRYRDINAWERQLSDEGIRLVKLFLNVSKHEQRKRFLKRIQRPDKRWKFSAADILEREHWDEYQHAYSQMLSHTSTEQAPWYVVPADHKWFARIAAAAALVGALAEIDPRYPQPDVKAQQAMEEARLLLEQEKI